MTKKRKLFDELMEGVDAMRQEREGKITLRSHEIDDLPPLEIAAATIRETREKLNVSRAVFARLMLCFSNTVLLIDRPSPVTESFFPCIQA